MRDFVFDRAAWAVLKAAFEGPATAAELAERAGLPLARAVNALDRLAGQGLVEKTGDAWRLVPQKGLKQEDLRAVEPAMRILSEELGGFVEAALAGKKATATLALGRLGPEGMAELLRRLEELKSWLEAQQEDAGGTPFKLVLAAWEA